MYNFVQDIVDKLVEGADDEKAEFITIYRNNRKLIDTVTSTIAFRGSIKTNSREPIGKVQFTLGKLKFKITAKDNFRLPNKEAAVFKFLVEKPGFKS